MTAFQRPSTATIVLYATLAVLGAIIILAVAVS